MSFQISFLCNYTLQKFLLLTFCKFKTQETIGYIMWPQMSSILNFIFFAKMNLAEWV